MTRQEQIDEMTKFIQIEYEQWLDTTGVIPKATTYYAECLGCAIDSAEALYNAGYRKEHILKKTKLSKLFQGDIFKWGEKEYVLLDIINGGYLCLAKDVWFNSKFDDKTNNWGHSELRSGMIEEVKDFIPDFYKLMLFDRDLTTDDGLTDYGHCKDNVSMLTCNEYREYRRYIPDIDKWCWTITAWTHDGDWVRCVDTNGCIDRGYAEDNDYGVRPLICLDKNTLVEVEE